MNNPKMPENLSSALRQNSSAMSFFSGCSDTQKQAIIRQAANITSKDAMKAFVEHLPSQTL